MGVDADVRLSFSSIFRTPRDIEFRLTPALDSGKVTRQEGTVTGPAKPIQQFPLLVKEGEKFDLPDGVIAHVTRQCDGNVHAGSFVEVTSSKSMSVEDESAEKSVPDLDSDSSFCSSYG
jgi:hypothetical protein